MKLKELIKDLDDGIVNLKAWKEDTQAIDQKEKIQYWKNDIQQTKDMIQEELAKIKY